MRLISWNVNGIRACLKKGFLEYFGEMDADIFCIQETKVQEGQVELDVKDYFQYWNYAGKKGYSGTAAFSKRQAINVNYGINSQNQDDEGRVITLEFENFYVVNVYTPNSQRGLKRLDYRLKWEDEFRKYLVTLDEKKPVILCGDLNVAHKEIDLKNPDGNRKNAGFTDQERSKMTALLNAGFVDTFRYFYPDRKENYTFWPYFRNSRERNSGWRIDYFIVSNRITGWLDDAEIYSEVMGSDHCPIGLKITLPIR